jgi:hypothetical protein
MAYSGGSALQAEESGAVGESLAAVVIETLYANGAPGVLAQQDG